MAVTLDRGPAITRYAVLLTPDIESGGYTVTVPALPGCITHGETVEEALANAQEAIAGHIAALRDLGEAVPVETTPPVLMVVEVEPAAYPGSAPSTLQPRSAAKRPAVAIVAPRATGSPGA